MFLAFGGGGARPSVVDAVIIVALSLLASAANQALAQEHFIANQPKFQVLSRNELAVDLPLPAGRDLVTFRMGLQRSGRYIEAVEWGTNDVMKNGKVLIKDDRLRLKDGDVINYLFGFRDHEGYQAQTGQYIFDGVFKRSRAKRHTEPRSTARPSDYEQDSSSDEEGSSSSETRFGGGHGRRGRWGHGHNHQHGQGLKKKCNDFNPFAASNRRPSGGGFPINQELNQFGPIRQPPSNFPTPAFPAQGFPPPGPGDRFPGGGQFYPNNRPHHGGGHRGHYHHGHHGHRGGGHHGNGRPYSDECNDENNNGDNNNNNDDNNETTTVLTIPRRTTPGTRNPSSDYPDIDIRFGQN